jgi:hypothetical protein
LVSGFGFDREIAHIILFTARPETHVDLDVSRARPCLQSVIDGSRWSGNGLSPTGNYQLHRPLAGIFPKKFA